MVEALGLGHRLGEHLARRIGERPPGEAERIDARGTRLGGVALEEVRRTRDLGRRGRGHVLADDQAVGDRTELHLDRRHQHADHRAAEHLRRQPDLVGGADDADVVRR